MKIVPYFVSIVTIVRPNLQPWNRISRMIWIHQIQQTHHHRPVHLAAKALNGPITYKQHKSDHQVYTSFILNIYNSVLSTSLPYKVLCSQNTLVWYIHAMHLRKLNESPSFNRSIAVLFFNIRIHYKMMMMMTMMAISFQSITIITYFFFSFRSILPLLYFI